MKLLTMDEEELATIKAECANDLELNRDRAAELFAEIEAQAAEVERLSAENEQLKDAILPDRKTRQNAVWWGVMQLATLASAHRQDSEMVDDAMKPESETVPGHPEWDFDKAAVERQARFDRLSRDHPHLQAAHERLTQERKRAQG